jgi:hypothetical protein
MITMDEAIRNYVRRGWSIIPIGPAEKRPLVRWEEFQHWRATEEEAWGWFRTWPDAGIGIVTGAISGLVVIDVDLKHGGNAGLKKLEGEHDRMPTTIECRTGGGGRHIYFDHPGGLIRNKVGLAPGVDLRGDGGYVVAPPSMHSSGVRYVWDEGRDPGSRAIAPLPDWVLQLAVDQPSRRGHSVAHWRQLVSDGVPEGERNNTIASLTGHLLRNGVDPAVAMELLLCWNRVRCRPPLPDDEVVAVVESITGIRERDSETRRSSR